MNKIILVLIFTVLTSALFADVIKTLPEDLLSACLNNLQVEDAALGYDKPSVKIGDPYSWIVSYEKGGYGMGFLCIPCGSVWDVKTIKIKYRVLAKDNASLKFVGRYNVMGDYANDYKLVAELTDNCEYTFTQEDLKEGEIKEVSFDNVRYKPDNFGFMQAVVFNFAGNSMTIEIIEVDLINSKGDIFNLWDYDWSMRAFELPPYVGKGKMPEIPNTIYTGSSCLEVTNKDGRERILRLKEIIPNLGFDGNGYAPAIPYFKDFFTENNIPAYYQFGGSCDIEPSVSQVKGHLETPLGISRDNNPGSGSVHHEFDWSDENVIAAFKEAITRCGNMGIPQFQFIDAVWQYNGVAGFDYGSLDWKYGNWGYNEKTLNNFRKALKEEDCGLIVGKYGEPGRRMFFHEYMKKYSGVSLKPADLGLKTWDEYVPCLNGLSPKNEIDGWKEKTGVEYDDLNFFLYIMVRHYEWLKLFSEVGDAGVKAGCDVVAMPNGNNWANGNDYLALIELATVKVIIDESRFYRPTLIFTGYAELPVWRQLIGKYNKHHRLICEIGAGGASNIYFSPLFSYVKNYSLQQSGHYDSMQTDWVWGAINENTKDQTALDSYVDFLFKSFGYNDATSDKGERTSDCKKAIFLTTPASIYVASPISNIVPETFKSSLKYTFYNNTFPYIKVDFTEYDILKPSCDLMIMDTVNVPAEFAQKLSKLASEKKMNILFHAYNAGNLADGRNFNNTWNKRNEALLQTPLGVNDETRKVSDRKNLYLSEHINKPDLFGTFFDKVLCDGIREIKGSVNGINVDYKGEYYFITSDKAKTLFDIEGLPILSQITLENGSKIFYYHINAGVCQELDDFIVAYVYKESNIKPEGETDNAYLERWENEKGSEVVALFSKSSFAKFAGPPIKHDYLDINDPSSKASAKVETKIKGEYVVYDFMNNKEVCRSSDRLVNLEMNGLAANLYYIIPLKDAEETVKTIKERKEKLDYWEKVRLEKLKNNE